MWQQSRLSSPRIRNLPSSKSGNPVDIDGGILVEGEGGELQIDYSYRTFLAKVWESGLKDASDILFG